MLATVKIAVFTIGSLLVGQLFGDISAKGEATVILNVLAIAAIAGSMLIYSRIKAALLVSESASKSWQSESDAQKERADRNAEALKTATLAQTELIAKLAALEQRPDLSVMQQLIAEGTESMKKHETQAAARTDRLIAVLEERLPPKQEAA